MRPLLWKEWREQRWRLGFSCLLLLAFALVGLKARAAADETTIAAVCFGAVLLLPLQAATGLVPAERADGTLSTLLSLPVRPAAVWAAKTVAGVVLVAGPLAVTAAASAAYVGGRELPAAGVLGLFARSAAAALALFAWMFALTVRSPTEARAGLLSLGILVGWGVTVLQLRDNGPYSPYSSLDRTEMAFRAFTPFAWTYGYDGMPAAAVWAAVATQAALAAVLWAGAGAAFARSVGSAGSAEGKP